MIPISDASVTRAVQMLHPKYEPLHINHAKLSEQTCQGLST
jgi:hypothetical protein